jgi:hypothetical protein
MMSEGRIRLAGSTRVERSSDRSLRLTGEIDGKPIGAISRPDGSVDIHAVPELSVGKSRLLKEFQQINKEMIEIGNKIGRTPTTTQSSCVGCLVVGGALSGWAGGCVLTGPGMVACYSEWAVASLAWYGQCEGACAD